MFLNRRSPTFKGCFNLVAHPKLETPVKISLIHITHVKGGNATGERISFYHHVPEKESTPPCTSHNLTQKCNESVTN